MLLRIINIDAVCIGTLPATIGITTLTGNVVKVDEDIINIGINPEYNNGKSSKRVSNHDIKVPYSTLTDEQLASANIEHAADIRLVEALRQLRDFDANQNVEFLNYFTEIAVSSMDNTSPIIGQFGTTSMSNEGKLLAILQLAKS
jgi:hypothetical protein